MAQYTLA